MKQAHINNICSVSSFVSAQHRFLVLDIRGTMDVTTTTTPTMTTTTTIATTDSTITIQYSYTVVKT